MRLTTTRNIDASIDVVWALQLDHEHWPDHLPNFSKVERRSPAEEFGVGSSAAITQPALGTVVWTVGSLVEGPDARSFAWSGTSKGITYTGHHQVRRQTDGSSELTLRIDMAGGLAAVLGPLVRRTVQKSLDAEAVAFERWALAVAAG